MSYKSYHEHADAIANRFKAKMTSKYVAGQSEHGGELWNKPTLKNLEEEVIDLVVYLDVLIEHQDQMLEFIIHAEEGAIPAQLALQKIKNIMLYGNNEGLERPE